MCLVTRHASLAYHSFLFVHLWQAKVFSTVYVPPHCLQVATQLMTRTIFVLIALIFALEEAQDISGLCCTQHAFISLCKCTVLIITILSNSIMFTFVFYLLRTNSFLEQLSALLASAHRLSFSQN